VSENIKVGVPKQKHLVFTSAGDRSNLIGWLSGRRNFDLWVTYYGNQSGQFKESADFYNYRRGGKFPNLHHLYQTWPDILGHYEAIMVMDDDIIIDTAAISRLFELREQFDLWLLQPAFDPKGKISHAITKVKPGVLLRYVNFVEVTCPLFKKEKLDGFMKVYDPALISWGVDWWYMHTLGPDLAGKVAIIDEITCINPHDSTKGGGQREIDLLEPKNERIACWGKFKTRYDIRTEAGGTMEYGHLPKDNAAGLSVAP
jgi:hypothetical protein